MAGRKLSLVIPQEGMKNLDALKEKTKGKAAG